MFDEFFHVTTKSREIGCDGGNTADDAFRGSVSPWFVVRWEDPEMTSSNEIVIVKRQQWCIRIQKLIISLLSKETNLWMEDDLDSI